MRWILGFVALLLFVLVASLLMDTSELSEGGRTDRCIAYTEMAIDLEPESLDVESIEELLPQYREKALNSDFYLTLDAILLRFLHRIRVVSASDVMDEAKSCMEFWTTR